MATNEHDHKAIEALLLPSLGERQIAPLILHPRPLTFAWRLARGLGTVLGVASDRYSDPYVCDGGVKEHSEL